MAGVIIPDQLTTIEKSKVLLVGAGGIGCEVLKCLVQSGFKQIDVIDMDTIDVSNLNRQFLFRKEHVGKPKSEVAKDSILQHYPDVSIKAHFRSIIDSELCVSWFKNFNLVINALDNVTARIHVNRMCLAAEIPLIESGTHGYEGQAELIIKGLTKCYECEPKEKPKTFPSCTIRNTPSEPIHCIVWSKNLFNQLFGEEDQLGEDSVSPDTEDPEVAGSAADSALTKAAGDGLINRKSTREWAKECNYDPPKLFHKFFYEDIQYLLSLHDLWNKRKPPKPIKFEEIPDSEPSTSTNGTDEVLKDQRLWSIKECVDVFCDSIKTLKDKFLSVQGTSENFLIWDKDDKPAMDFVTACSNIRSFIFEIPRKSRYDVKSMAGNIIPAIATANAMVASLVVFQAVNVLSGNVKACRTVYLRREPNHKGEIMAPERDLLPPKPTCYICSSNPEVTLSADLHKLTIKQFDEEVLKKCLNVIEPDVTISESSLTILTSEDDYEEEYLSRTLSQFGIKEGTLLYVDDFLQTCKFYIRVSERTVENERETALFEIVRHAEITSAPDEENDKQNGHAEEPEEEEDDVIMVENGDSAEVKTLKRKVEEDVVLPEKKQKV